MASSTAPAVPTFPADEQLSYCMRCGSKLAQRIDHNGVIRKACSDKSCSWVFYQNPVIVVAALVEHYTEEEYMQKPKPQPHIILARGVGWPSSWFGLITGYLESREHPEEGLLREVKEELGLDARNPKWVGIYEFRRANQIIVAYSVEAVGEITLDTTELQEYKRVPIDKLRPWPQGTGMAVKQYLKERWGKDVATVDNFSRPKSNKPATSKL